MRSIEEIGTFEERKDPEIQKWYAIYASLYLDFVDDNINHFFNRCIDFYPIRNCEDKSKWADLYKEAARDLDERGKDCMDNAWWEENYPGLCLSL